VIGPSCFPVPNLKVLRCNFFSFFLSQGRIRSQYEAGRPALLYWGFALGSVYFRAKIVLQLVPVPFFLCTPSRMLPFPPTPVSCFDSPPQIFFLPSFQAAPESSTNSCFFSALLFFAALTLSFLTDAPACFSASSNLRVAVIYHNSPEAFFFFRHLPPPAV